MEELVILNVLAENPNTSQRKIAERAGISLGQVNFLIKKCVRTGLIKIEGQTPKSLRYNLTPKGMAEKAEKTLQYIKSSYCAVMKYSAIVKELGEKYMDRGYGIYLLGHHDEMMEICKLALIDLNIDFGIIDTENKDIKSTRPVLFYWEEGLRDNYRQYESVNVLNVK